MPYVPQGTLCFSAGAAPAEAGGLFAVLPAGWRTAPRWEGARRYGRSGSGTRSAAPLGPGGRGLPVPGSTPEK